MINNDTLIQLVKELSKNYTKIVTRHELEGISTLSIGKNGVGNRWCRSLFCYSVVYSNSQRRQYGECEDKTNFEFMFNNIESSSTGKKIHGIYIHGLNIEKPISRTVSKSIKENLNINKCLLCGSTSELVVDHKNDFYPKLNHPSSDDFQILCNGCNLRKRSINTNTEKKNGVYYGAFNLEYLHPIIEKYSKTQDLIIYDTPFNENIKENCFYFDPKYFMRRIGFQKQQQSFIDDVNMVDSKKFIFNVPNGSVDLILTDPPYMISKNSGMQKHYEAIQNGSTKSIDEWNEFLSSHNDRLYSEKEKDDYLLYGSIYGKKYATQTSFGDWDNDFTMDDMELMVKQFYRVMKKGATCIIFFDGWKITLLHDLLKKYNFKQLRIIDWIKTNPQPINSSRNYLSNAKEIAISCVKGGCPTFNSKYDKGVYVYPNINTKGVRFHPTQKNLSMFETLVEKHSNEGDIVFDPFAGSGTTHISCFKTNRRYIGCEMDETYFGASQFRFIKEHYKINKNKRLLNNQLNKNDCK
ncbi:MAG: site-specific DNA-methyltransferase [Clostridium sp.]